MLVEDGTMITSNECEETAAEDSEATTSEVTAIDSDASAIEDSEVTAPDSKLTAPDSEENTPDSFVTATDSELIVEEDSEVKVAILATVSETEAGANTKDLEEEDSAVEILDLVTPVMLLN